MCRYASRGWGYPHSAFPRLDQWITAEVYGHGWAVSSLLYATRPPSRSGPKAPGGGGGGGGALEGEVQGGAMGGGAVRRVG